jgi:hypothetical protein
VVNEKQSKVIAQLKNHALNWQVTDSVGLVRRLLDTSFDKWFYVLKTQKLVSRFCDAPTPRGLLPSTPLTICNWLWVHLDRHLSNTRICANPAMSNRVASIGPKQFADLAAGTLKCEDEKGLASDNRGRLHNLPVLLQSSDGGV